MTKSITVILTYTLMLCIYSVSEAQSLSFDLSTNGSFISPRDVEFPVAGVRSSDVLSILYSDSFNSHLDFKVGPGYFNTSEFYTISDLFPDVEIDQVVNEKYNADYLLLNVGIKYWFDKERKGVYLESVLSPYLLVKATKKTMVNEGGVEMIILEDVKNEFDKFNILISTGVAYDFRVYRKISAYFGMFGVLKIGSSNEFRKDRRLLTSRINIGLSYTL